MTLPEAGHKVIDAMSGSPVLMAVIVLQLATLAGIYFYAAENNDRQQQRELALIAQCQPERLP